MKKRIAIPLEDGMLCAHFGHCEKFAIVQVDQGRVESIQEFPPPDHVPGLYPRWIAGFGVTDVIAGGMGQKAISIFNDCNINVFAGAPVRPPRELVEDFLAGRLDLSANYCQHDHSCHQE